MDVAARGPLFAQPPVGCFRPEIHRRVGQRFLMGAEMVCTTSQEQVRATEATRRLQEEKLRVETEKLRVGKSTSILVAAAQRDLLSSQISEVRAVVTNLKAVIDLYRLEGSLLEHRAIACPGAEPVAVAED